MKKELIAQIVFIVVLFVLALLDTYYVKLNGLFRCEGNISIVRNTPFCITNPNNQNK